MSQILIAEDEVRIASFIKKGLKSHYFQPMVAQNAQETINLALSGQFQMLLLDLGLPGKDGLQILQELRGQGAKLPIIILTARDELQDKITALEGGADDYMTKPFRFEELLARIKLRMRSQNVSSSVSERILTAHNVTLDLRMRKAKVAHQWIELTTREFILAEQFFRHPQQVLTRQQILDHVWGFDYDPGSNIVDVYVGYLRKKLGNNLIETIRGAGYRLNPV